MPPNQVAKNRLIYLKVKKKAQLSTKKTKRNPVTANSHRAHPRSCFSEEKGYQRRIRHQRGIAAGGDPDCP